MGEDIGEKIQYVVGELQVLGRPKYPIANRSSPLHSFLFIAIPLSSSLVDAQERRA